jgi:hypothetical protein
MVVRTARRGRTTVTHACRPTDNRESIDSRSQVRCGFLSLASNDDSGTMEAE